MDESLLRLRRSLRDKQRLTRELQASNSLARQRQRPGTTLTPAQRSRAQVIRDSQRRAHTPPQPIPGFLSPPREERSRAAHGSAQPGGSARRVEFDAAGAPPSAPQRPPHQAAWKHWTERSPRELREITTDPTHPDAQRLLAEVMRFPTGDTPEIKRKAEHGSARPGGSARQLGFDAPGRPASGERRPPHHAAYLERGAEIERRQGFVTAVPRNMTPAWSQQESPTHYTVSASSDLGAAAWSQGELQHMGQGQLLTMSPRGRIRTRSRIRHRNRVKSGALQPIGPAFVENVDPAALHTALLGTSRVPSPQQLQRNMGLFTPQAYDALTGFEEQESRPDEYRLFDEEARRALMPFGPPKTPSAAALAVKRLNEPISVPDRPKGRRAPRRALPATAERATELEAKNQRLKEIKMHATEVQSAIKRDREKLRTIQEKEQEGTVSPSPSPPPETSQTAAAAARKQFEEAPTPPWRTAANLKRLRIQSEEAPKPPETPAADAALAAKKLRIERFEEAFTPVVPQTPQVTAGTKFSSESFKGDSPMESFDLTPEALGAKEFGGGAGRPGGMKHMTGRDIGAVSGAGDYSGDLPILPDASAKFDPPKAPDAMEFQQQQTVQHLRTGLGRTRGAVDRRHKKQQDIEVDIREMKAGTPQLETPPAMSPIQFDTGEVESRLAARGDFVESGQEFSIEERHRQLGDFVGTFTPGSTTSYETQDLTQEEADVMRENERASERIARNREMELEQQLAEEIPEQRKKVPPWRKQAYGTDFEAVREHDALRAKAGLPRRRPGPESGGTGGGTGGGTTYMGLRDAGGGGGGGGGGTRRRPAAPPPVAPAAFGAGADGPPRPPAEFDEYGGGPGPHEAADADRFFGRIIDRAMARHAAPVMLPGQTQIIPIPMGQAPAAAPAAPDKKAQEAAKIIIKQTVKQTVNERKRRKKDSKDSQKSSLANIRKQYNELRKKFKAKFAALRKAEYEKSAKAIKNLKSSERKSAREELKRTLRAKLNTLINQMPKAAKRKYGDIEKFILKIKTLKW